MNTPPPQAAHNSSEETGTRVHTACGGLFSDLFQVPPLLLSFAGEGNFIDQPLLPSGFWAGLATRGR